MVNNNNNTKQNLIDRTNLPARLNSSLQDRGDQPKGRFNMPLDTSMRTNSLVSRVGIQNQGAGVPSKGVARPSLPVNAVINTSANRYKVSQDKPPLNNGSKKVQFN